jgi:nitroreductase
MKPVTNETIEKQLNWRYATKKYDPTRRISPADWRTLEQALVLSPSSYGLQPWKFVVVNDPDVRARLKPAAWNQPQITDASHLVVFAIKKNLGAADVDRLVRRTAEVRGVPVEALDGYRDLMLARVNRDAAADVDHWSSRQAYIALGEFLTAAAMLGIDANPMEGFENHKFDEILGLDKHGYHAVVIAAAGYRAPDDRYASLPKVRYESSDVLVTI